MRVELRGVYSLDEFEKAISQLTKNFRVNNIETIRNVNLYFYPIAHGTNIHLYAANGEEIEHMVMDLSRHKKFVPSTDDLSIVSMRGMSAIKSHEEE